MSTWLLILVTLAYLYVSIDLAFRGQWAKAMIFFGYFFANIGVICVVQ